MTSEAAVTRVGAVNREMLRSFGADRALIGQNLLADYGRILTLLIGSPYSRNRPPYSAARFA
jgi:hypothetical protein